ncbi:MAG: hypothetical protein J6M40_07840 [Prevotella sp.]|nr:hypothetical protein [Prevotella sp.]
MRRLLYLDNLKVCLTVLAIFHHAAQAYGAYIFHLLLMLVLQHAVDGIWMGAFGKFMFIGISITIASFVFTWLLRMIPGVKKVLSIIIKSIII